jgi:pimeloyl-ACP methyl ester carboxylesterase
MLDGDALRRERSILAMTTNLARDNDARALAWSRFHDDAPIGRGTVLRQLLAGMRFRAPARIASPVLVLSSAKDGFTSPECCRRLARHFGAEIRVHPEASHDLGTDAPEWIVEQLKGWTAA